MTLVLEDWFSIDNPLYVIAGNRMSDTIGQPARQTAGPASFASGLRFYDERVMGSREITK